MRKGVVSIHRISRRIGKPGASTSTLSAKGRFSAGPDPKTRSNDSPVDSTRRDHEVPAAGEMEISCDPHSTDSKRTGTVLSRPRRISFVRASPVGRASASRLVFDSGAPERPPRTRESPSAEIPRNPSAINSWSGGQARITLCRRDQARQGGNPINTTSSRLPIRRPS